MSSLSDVQRCIESDSEGKEGRMVEGKQFYESEIFAYGMGVLVSHQFPNSSF